VATVKITTESLTRREAVRRWVGLGATLVVVGFVFAIGMLTVRIVRKGITHWRASARLQAAGVSVGSGVVDIWAGKVSDTSVYAQDPKEEVAFDDAMLARIADLEAVEVVHLVNCGLITDKGLAVFERLNGLKGLELGGDSSPPRVTDQGLDHLLGLKKLTFLSLNGTKITDAGVVKLARMEQLEALELDGTGVTDASLPVFIKQFPKLQNVHLTKTKITREGFMKLLQARPTLEIFDGGEIEGMRGQFGVGNAQ
jgi:hypothetical protein